MIGTYFSWWISQLADLLPEALRRASRAGPDALLIEPNGTQIVVLQRRNGGETPVAEFAVGTTAPLALPRSSAQPAVLRLAKADVLEKTLTLPIATQSRLAEVLAFEMDLATPFAADEVYWAYDIEAVDRQRGTLSVRLLLILKAKLAPVLAALASAGIAPQWIEVRDAPGGCAFVPIAADSRRRYHGSHRSLWPVAGCCAILALAMVIVPFVQQSVELAALERDTAAARAKADQAEASRRGIERLSRSAEFIDDEIKKTGRPLEIVASVTELVPDDTYLTEFELRQRKLTIGGRSADAAKLLATLAANPRFRNAMFAAPVTRLEALRAEVFTVAADVERSP